MPESFSDLVRAIVQRWDTTLSRPTFEAVDYQQARMAAEVAQEHFVGLVEAQAAYIVLLEKAGGSAAAFLHVHGQTADPSDVARGRELRLEIERLGGAPFHE